MLTKMTRTLAALWTIFVAATSWPASGHSTANECTRLIGNPPQPLFETGALYRYLKDLDNAQCPKLGQVEFEKFIDPLEVNLVSYVLLESRLAEGGANTGQEAIAAYLKQYKDANIKLDDNALLPLIDIAFYTCKGAADCIGAKVTSQIDVGSMQDNAACLFGLPSSCAPTQVRKHFYFLNDATLKNFPSAENAYRERSRFICERYRACAHSSQ
ncbi:hypothetical protein SAMN05880590_104342 [Rhizobium sp. RU35A]|uniref:hypothetical protein n=1 Tax=Rhizobium sp. RU35A TaxID=1907414 RepID=UPI0009563936|nr:hypothetical protein [Rhizobium sp. RU35A]SIQ49487.1 hypothetical protein SAMN05880590_104342 [Rhizobium sp. RU35A]